MTVFKIDKSTWEPKHKRQTSPITATNRHHPHRQLQKNSWRQNESTCVICSLALPCKAREFLGAFLEMPPRHIQRWNATGDWAAVEEKSHFGKWGQCYTDLDCFQFWNVSSGRMSYTSRGARHWRPYSYKRTIRTCAPEMPRGKGERKR